MGIKINTEMESKEPTNRSLTWFEPKQTSTVSKSTNVPIPYRPKDETDFSNIVTTNNRAYDADAMGYINKKLQNLSDVKRSIILGTIIEESGGNPFAKSDNGTYQGLLQWSADRYRMPSDITDKYQAIDHQLNYLSNTINNLNDKVSWTHGGSGSNYNDRKEAYNNFQSDDLWTAHRAFSYGYVRPKGKEDSAKNRYDVIKQIYDRSDYKNGGIIKIQNGGFTTKQQEDNKAFFEDFSERYNKLHGVDKSSVIQETLKKETPVIDPNGRGNCYVPKKDEINLVSTNSPAHFTHEFVHKLNDSLPPRLERSQEEVDLLTEAYPLGKLQNSTERYKKYAGNIEHFTTNTTLRRNISDKNNGVLGEDLNKVILEMPAKELGIEAGGSGYASPRDYFKFKPEINSVESYYKAMGNETPWESLKRKEKKNWDWQYKNKIGVEKIGVPNEELINKVREALIKVASTNNIDLSNHG